MDSGFERFDRLLFIGALVHVGLLHLASPAESEYWCAQFTRTLLGIIFRTGCQQRPDSHPGVLVFEFHR